MCKWSSSPKRTSKLKDLQMEGSSFAGPFHGPVSLVPVPSPTSQGIHLMGSLGLSTLGGFELAQRERCWKTSLHLRKQGKHLKKIHFLNSLIRNGYEKGKQRKGEGFTAAEESGGWRCSGQANSNGQKCTRPQAVFRGQTQFSNEEGESSPTLHLHLMRDIWKGKVWNILIGIHPGEESTSLFQAMQVKVRDKVLLPHPPSTRNNFYFGSQSSNF